MILSIGGSLMSNQRFSPEFKDEAVRQVIDSGYSVAVVAARGVTWVMRMPEIP